MAVSNEVRVLDGETPTVVFVSKEAATGAKVVRKGAIGRMSTEQLRATPASQKLLDSVRADRLPPILTAADVFQKRNLDIRLYLVKLLRTPSSFVITFTDKDAQGGGRGAPGKRPGFEIELNAADLRVLRAHFIR